MLERIPPHSLEAEQSVLGALLIDKDAIIQVAEFLRDEHFYKEAHQQIFETMASLYEKREPIDIITVSEELKRKKRLDKVGGSGYLAQLASFVPTASHVEHYGRIVRDHFTRRQLIAAAGKMTDLAFNEAEAVAPVLDKAEQSLFGISQEHLRTGFVSVKEALEISFDRLDELHKKAGSLRGVPTGFPTLNRKLSGLQESNMIILAARPSVGKTSLALNIAQHASVEDKIPVGIFSLETSKEQLVDRLLASVADVDAWRITTGYLEEEDFTKLGEAMGKLAEAPLFIDDTAGISVMEMRTKARRLQVEKGLKLLIVDYLQLVAGRGLENRVQEVSEISQALKNLAREIHIPVLAISQLSRAVESRQTRIPQLSDLRESGSLEQDADVVMFLYREDEENRQNVKLTIAKHRNGPTGEMDLYFRGDRTRFYEVEKAAKEEKEGKEKKGSTPGVGG